VAKRFCILLEQVLGNAIKRFLVCHGFLLEKVALRINHAAVAAPRAGDVHAGSVVEIAAPLSRRRVPSDLAKNTSTYAEVSHREQKYKRTSGERQENREYNLGVHHFSS